MAEAALETAPLPISTVRRGEIVSWSRTLIPTAKDAPTDAEAPSHKLLSRGGYIRRVAAGVYDYLPLAWRVLRKIEQIVREEMNGAGASELLMPALTPIELFAETGRAEAYGPLLFRLEDRHGREAALGPTHEEVITELMRGVVSSYKQLPLNLYQIQTKFRDEFRPRAGLLRCREFIMKDAYSFHMNVEGKGGLNEAYDAMYRAYVNSFTRCGLDFTVVEAESGPIGGSASHEFMVNCESGEDTILRCPATGYAANVEKCEIGERPHSFEGEPTGPLEVVHTPDCPGIEDVSRFLKVKPPNMLKTLVFKRADGAGWVLAVVRGDHDANEGKVKAASGGAGGAVAMADEKEAKAAGFAIGYVSPRAALSVPNTLLLVDPDAAQGMDRAKGKPSFWAAGADRHDHHVKHFNWQREMGAVLKDHHRVRVADIRNAMAGDPSPRAPGAALEAKRGIEVGHIFKLGTKYSDAMGFAILDEKQEKRSVIMGCYGIGVSRTMASCVEMSHDADGIVWPLPIAPFHIIITPMRVEPDAPAMKAACELAGRLAASGFDVLVDDRDERPGVKFKDADLIGIPIRLTLGDKALAEHSVEFKERRDRESKGELVKMDAVVERCLRAAGSVK
ncbi:MAG TPA: proline--tRNA ligase [Phycisphaerales bacterium]|nr:proline--tRNA ligase [Phycisphaerales bacterium]